jgi:hypothetical protein
VKATVLRLVGQCQRFRLARQGITNYLVILWFIAVLKLVVVRPYPGKTKPP